MRLVRHIHHTGALLRVVLQLELLLRVRPLVMGVQILVGVMPRVVLAVVDGVAVSRLLAILVEVGDVTQVVCVRRGELLRLGVAHISQAPRHVCDAMVSRCRLRRP